MVAVAAGASAGSSVWQRAALSATGAIAAVLLPPVMCAGLAHAALGYAP